MSLLFWKSLLIGLAGAHATGKTTCSHQTHTAATGLSQMDQQSMTTVIEEDAAEATSAEAMSLLQRHASLGASKRSVVVSDGKQDWMWLPPAFADNCSWGYTTQAVLDEYLQLYPDMPSAATKTLIADPNTSRPLYPWQLYSVLGTERIFDIVHNFYVSVSQDKQDPWLALAFEPNTTWNWRWERQVTSQAHFWLDAMGNGPVFPGGLHRIYEAHKYGPRYTVLNNKGALSWAHHMRIALAESNLSPDPRVRGAIDTFFHVRMVNYGYEFNFTTADVIFGSQRSDDWVPTSSTVTGTLPVAHDRGSAALVTNIAKPAA